MNTEIIVVAISSVVAISVAAVSYVQAKKLKFFETFFQRKADAFEEYMEKISSVPTTKEELYAFCASSRKATLYSFAKNRGLIDALMDLGIKAHLKRGEDGQIPEEFQNAFRIQRTEIITALRDEMQQSTKFKYN